MISTRATLAQHLTVDVLSNVAQAVSLKQWDVARFLVWQALDSLLLLPSGAAPAEEERLKPLVEGYMPKDDPASPPPAGWHRSPAPALTLTLAQLKMAIYDTLIIRGYRDSPDGIDWSKIPELWQRLREGAAAPAPQEERPRPQPVIEGAPDPFTPTEDDKRDARA